MNKIILLSCLCITPLITAVKIFTPFYDPYSVKPKDERPETSGGVSRMGASNKLIKRRASRVSPTQKAQLKKVK